MATTEKPKSPSRLLTFEEFVAGDAVYNDKDKEETTEPAVPSEDNIEADAEKDAEKDIAKKDGKVQAAEAGEAGDDAAAVADGDDEDAEEEEEDDKEEEDESEPEA